MRKKLLILGLIVVLILSWPCFWLAGHWTGGYQERHQRFIEERDMVTPFLASDPAFQEVLVLEETGPGGGIFIWGMVKTRAAMEKLQKEVKRLFGEPRGDKLLKNGPILDFHTAPKK
jgi:hypothetical protein